MKGYSSLRVVPSKGSSWVGSGFFGVLKGPQARRRSAPHRHRLVSRGLARMFAEFFDKATRPYQLVLQARVRAPTHFRACSAVDLDFAATMVSLGGRSAYKRYDLAFCVPAEKLRNVVPTFVPYVRMWYGQQST